MKAMPLSFEQFQGKGVLDFSSSTSSCSDSSLLLQNHHHHQQAKSHNSKEGFCYVGSDPTSINTRRSPSSPTSSSTLSSSFGKSGGGGSGASTDNSGVAATKAVSSSNNNKGSSQPVDIGAEKCGSGMEDWESVMPGSPSQDQSILRLIMGDIDDLSSMGLNKVLQSGGGSQDMEFNAGFGLVDQGFSFGFESITSGGNLLSNANPCIDMVSAPSNPAFTSSPHNLLPTSLPPPGVFAQQQQQRLEALDEKPQLFNPQMIMNQNQAHFTQNPATFFPLSYAHLQEHNLLSSPPPKKLNSGSTGPNSPFSGPRQELYLRSPQQPTHLLQQRPSTIGMTATAKPKTVSDELANQQLQQAIIDQLIQAAELIETGDPALAQGILARLNHQLSPAGKPFIRAAFYFKEALQLLLRLNASNTSALTTYNMIFKIGAYKSFSEISPVVQFANFTCNQALLEVFEGCSRIHIIDFDIGYGGQWASLMQELVLRSGGAPSMKITAFESPSNHDGLELGFTQENLKHFASEINMALDIEIMNLESLNSCSWPLPLHFAENEAIAVNLPIGSFSNYPSTLPLVLRFVKQLSPKIVVSLDRGCDRTDVPFPHHIIHALQSYSGLLESLDAVNMNLDALEKIERFFLQPSIEKIVLGRHRSPERRPSWRSLFMQSGFSPLTFSNFTESQAECLIQRSLIRGFHVEKRQSSLVLCWQRRELIAASAWRC
ncbi:ARABIDOPSIS THALIANA HAIRY MERISTEM 3, LOST MERISTEMS 3, HAIRY MERISTEM 3 [Hibiscus trionum]|uniref:ARABIDOPSIS THALIANA HAIRY MERISTEM 3, LOST MERISTEMS 3, HAIRY MERISTEM 3 n=1 Tax=Hibiscus trionum TaxID=183268 RepID=A0A9W7H2U2_HIBTR|nr:ARABIDOPSIS THALIANA HAIRY MERISTEM 3, LOST MERISTEMS 3, HAIRY MERISTEM 3 [Hibiscus trionum]